MALLACTSCLVYCLNFIARSSSAPSASASHIEFRPNPVLIPTEQGRLYADGMAVEVFNTSDRPASILGMKEFCSSACYSGSGLPLTIPPRGSARISLRVHVNTPGPISEQVEFFTDDRAHPIITLNVVGDLQEPTEPDVYDTIGSQ